MNNLLNEDSQATLLICSNLSIGLTSGEVLKPYTLSEWNKLTNLLKTSELKSPKAFFHTRPEEWKNNLKFADSEVERLTRLLDNGARLALELDKLNSLGIWITTRAEESYPNILKERLKQKCPVFLYCAGSQKLFNTKGVAIVGSRNIDESGLEFTKRLSERCTEQGFTIISGGAKGVDSIAQDTAIKSDGTVISVVSDSLEMKIKNKVIREAIMRKQLLLVSPFHPRSTFKVYNAMDRNKYIYALSQYAVAVSSDFGKGGTWAGAKENLRENWVPLFVREEANAPKGNLELIKIGAHPLSKEALEKEVLIFENFLLKKDKEVIQEEKKEQLTIEQLLNLNEKKQDINKVAPITLEDSSENSKEFLITEELENTSDKFIEEVEQDLNESAYDILKSFLLKVLSKPRNIEELSNILDTRKIQTQDWVEKLLQENLVEKLYKPVRYTKKHNV